jgi:hypothetical protein
MRKPFISEGVTWLKTYPFRDDRTGSQYTTMSREKHDPPASWIETEATTAKETAGEELSKDPATESTPAKPRVKKYVVRCKYHTSDAIAYRIYAQSKEDAEEIARIKFKGGDNRGRLLDTVKAVEVVNE